MKKILLLLMISIFFVSCVSQRKYSALQALKDCQETRDSLRQMEWRLNNLVNENYQLRMEYKKLQETLEGKRAKTEKQGENPLRND